MTTFLAFRLSEVVPYLPLVRPVFFVSLLSVAYLLQSTPRAKAALIVKNPVFLGILGYAAVAVVGVPFALSRGIAFRSLSAFAYAIVIQYCILAMPSDRRSLDRFVSWIVFCATLILAGWLLTGNRIAGRLTTAGSYDPNDLAAMACFLLPLALWQIARSEIRWKIVGLTCAALISVTIALAGSRGGFIGFGVAILTFLIRLPFRRLVISTALAIPTMLLGWQFGPSSLRERASSLVTLNEDYNATSNTGRIAIWKRGIGHFARHPVLGVGGGNYSVAEGNYFQETNTIAAYFTAHNTFIQAFVEFGVFGGLLVGWLAARSIYVGWQFSRRSGLNGEILYRPDLFAACVAYFVAAFFLSHAITYLFFCIVAIMGYAGDVLKRERVAVAS